MQPRPEHNAAFMNLRWTTTTSLKPADPADDLLKYEVELLCPVDEDYEIDEPIGHFSIWRFNIAANQERGEDDLLVMFDADSGEAEALYYALFNSDTDDFREEVVDDITCGCDVLYFQMANFSKELLRDPILLATAERIIQTIGSGCACAALWLGDEPFPKRKEYTSDDMLKFWEAQKQSESFWGRIGFKRLPETFFLVRNLALRPPLSIREILGDDAPCD